MKGIMDSRQLPTGGSNVSRALAWLGIIAMFAFFWIGVAGLVLRLLFRDA